MNFFTKLFMVLLRIAIGWHLCYEGITKLEGTWSGKKPFSAEGYLRNSTGPLRGTFRAMIPDFYGLEKLDAQTVTDNWKAILDKTALRVGFSDDQRAQAEAKLSEATAKLHEYLDKEETRKKIGEYREQVETWSESENRQKTTFEQAENRKLYTAMEATRRELTGPVVSLENEFKDQLHEIMTEAQRQAPTPRFDWQAMSQLEQANMITMYGLTILGALLVAGLFSRLSALGAACLLGMFYFSMPPWPEYWTGVPVNPMAEGTYLIVNKNLIEMIALLMLATAPTGVWAGLDAFIRGFITRPLFGVGAAEMRAKYEKNAK